MTKEEIIEMAKKCGWDNPANNMTPLYEFAKLVAEHEREKVQGRIETLHAMFVLASKQRDELMDEQRAQVAAIREKHRRIT